MKILLTGATGFIGSHLLRALAADTRYELAVIVRPDSKLDSISHLSDQYDLYVLQPNYENLHDIVQQSQPDCVIHLASLFISEHQSTQVTSLFESNVLFPTKLLEAMAQQKIATFINTGTSWEHFNGATDYDPVNLYAASKKAFADVLTYYTKVQGIKAVTIKLFDTYGPDDERKKLFYLLTTAQKNNTLIDFSPGEQTLDLLYIDDVITAYLKTIDYLKQCPYKNNQTIFIGSGVGATLKSVVKCFEEVSGESLQINWGGRAYRQREVMKAAADIRNAKAWLDWQPTISLKQGLSKMLGKSI